MQAVSTQEVMMVPRARRAENEKFGNDGSYESVYLQLYKLAMKCYGRVEQLGLLMTFDDVMQEMNLSYVRAREKWNPDGGALFVTYMTYACYNNFNDRIRRMETERRNLGMINMSSISRVNAEGDEDGDFMEHYNATESTQYHVEATQFSGNGVDDYMRMEEPTMGAGETPEAILEARQSAKESLRGNLERLTPQARLIVLSIMDAAHKGNDLPKFGDVATQHNLPAEEVRRIRAEIRKALGVKI